MCKKETNPRARYIEPWRARNKETSSLGKKSSNFIFLFHSEFPRGHFIPLPPPQHNIYCSIPVFRGNGLIPRAIPDASTSEQNTPARFRERRYVPPPKPWQTYVPGIISEKRSQEINTSTALYLLSRFSCLPLSVSSSVGCQKKKKKNEQKGV